MSGRPFSNRDRMVDDAQSPRRGPELRIQTAVRGLFTSPNKIEVVGTKCIICQETYNMGMKPEIPIALPGCGHIFGSVCISRWLHTAERKNGCPLCRRNLFGRLHGNLIDEEDETEENAGDEGIDLASPMTPIDTPFAPSDLADEIQGWGPFQEPQSVVDSNVLDLQGEQQRQQQRHLPNNAPQSIVDDEGGRIASLTAAALGYFLGDYPSTVAVMNAVRRRLVGPYEMIIEDIVDDHRHLFTESPDQQPSSPEQTRLAYDFVKTAFRYAAKWLRGHPPHYDLHVQYLYVFLERRLRERAANLRDYDIIRLTDLIKAGILSSPRMEESFDDRMRMSQSVAGDIESLRNGESEPRPYMAQWMRAMPLLASAVRQIVEHERFMPLRTVDIDCESLWNEEMEPIQPVVLDPTSQAAEPTPDPPPAASRAFTSV